MRWIVIGLVVVLLLLTMYAPFVLSGDIAEEEEREMGIRRS
jgi:hypothetical protein